MITATRAAILIANAGGANAQVRNVFANDRGTEAAIVRAWRQNWLVVAGSNDQHDWLRNVRFFGASWPEAGHSGRRYHRGHLAGAREIFDWLKWIDRIHGYKIDIATGHSRGGPLASIVATSLGVPAITFAAPPCVYGFATMPGDALVVNYCRRDDFVCYAPPWLHRIGRTVWLDAPWKFGESHVMRHYRPHLPGDQT